MYSFPQGVRERGSEINPFFKYDFSYFFLYFYYDLSALVNKAIKSMQLLQNGAVLGVIVLTGA